MEFSHSAVFLLSMDGGQVIYTHITTKLKCLLYLPLGILCLHLFWGSVVHPIYSGEGIGFLVMTSATVYLIGLLVSVFSASKSFHGLIDRILVLLFLFGFSDASLADLIRVQCIEIELLANFWFVISSVVLATVATYGAWRTASLRIRLKGLDDIGVFVILSFAKLMPSKLRRFRPFEALLAEAKDVDSF